METWVAGLKRLAGCTKLFPQSAYAGLAMLLQQEWKFSQRVTPSVGTLFAPLEAKFREKCHPTLLGVRIEEFTYSLYKRITWGVNQAGIGIPDPTQTSPANFETL